MAHGVLAIRGYVGERAAVRRVIEDRVVAEPSGTGGMRRDLTLDGTSRLEDDAVVFGEGKRADESGGAARRAGAMPGAPWRASISSPESSATAGRAVAPE